MKATPLSAVTSLKFVNVNVSVVVPPTEMASGAKALSIVGGAMIVTSALARLLRMPASTAVPGAKMAAVFTSVPLASGETAQVAV